MSADTIEIVDHHQGFKLWWHLFEIKKYFVTMLKKFFPEAPAALLAGILVGEQSLFPKQTLTDFQLAGLTHIIVLSGYNITLLVTFFVTIFSWFGLGFRGRRIGAMIAIPLFIVMTGMGTSLIRAGIMALAAMLLQVTTRPNHNFRILVITAGLMIFQNPRILMHSPSFHLSFLAFIGLVYVVPLAHVKFEKLPELFGLRTIAVETTAIQLFVLPYILWMSGQVSAGSLLANILIVPTISLIMFGGFVAVIIGMIMPFWGGLVAPIITWGLQYILFIAHKVAGFSGVSFIMPSFSAWVMVGVYGILGVLLTKISIKNYVSKNLSKITNP